ncbi:MAG: nucleoside triphosphate pyrophosphohydrolase [Hyphomicrobiales bacterium]
MKNNIPIPFDHPFQEDDLSDVETLRKIMAALRDPDSGCPWDVEQTFATIAPYTIEEAYEVADAIENNDRLALCDELGDLLLQVIYHARMAEEECAFDLDDVVACICTKMLRRHPHVFGDEAARSAGVAKGFWEKIKAAEKSEIGKSGQKPASSKSVLVDIPPNLPALMRAVKLQKRAARVGFDWPHWDDVLLKASEELGEIREAMGTGDQQKISEEIGDLLFVVANMARHHDIDPEDALRKANSKFTRRFHYIEEKLAANNRHPTDSNLEEMDGLWDEAKIQGL